MEKCAEEVMKVSDVKKIKWKDSSYYPGVRTAEHTLTCEIRGEPVRLSYEVSKHDDGEGFVIHSDGKDIWDVMPESELRKLEPLLAEAVEYGHWNGELARAQTPEAVREVRYGLYELENSMMTRDRIRALHTAIDEKEAALEAAGRSMEHGRKPAMAPVTNAAPTNEEAEPVQYRKAKTR